MKPKSQMAKLAGAGLFQMGPKCQARHPQPQPSGHSPKLKCLLTFSSLLIPNPRRSSCGSSFLVLVLFTFHPLLLSLAHLTLTPFSIQPPPVLPVSFLHLIHLPIHLSLVVVIAFSLPQIHLHPHSLYSFSFQPTWRLLLLGTAGKSLVVTTPVRVHRLLCQP